MRRRNSLAWGITVGLVLALLAFVVGHLVDRALPAEAQAPARISVGAAVYGDGLRVAWRPVAGATLQCVTRPGGQQALDCPEPAGAWRQGSRDAGLLVAPGGVVEVRAWRGEALIAVGQARVRWIAYLPLASRRR